MPWSDAWPALALMVLVVSLPWGVRMAKRRGWLPANAQNQVATVLSVTPLSPQQKVVTLNIDHGHHRKVLLIGVTAQSMCVLDSWTPSAPPVPSSEGDRDT